MKPLSPEFFRAPIARWRCTDPKPMTAERVLAIIRQKGEFRVSWRYRDEPMMRACNKMRKAGLLRMERGRGETIFTMKEARRDDQGRDDLADHEARPARDGEDRGGFAEALPAR